MSDSFRYEHPDLFTAGTVGPRGRRTFYIQFGNAGDLATLKVEKGQVHALAEFLDQLLDDTEPLEPDQIPLALDLVEPLDVAWAVSSIGVGFEEAAQQFVLVVEELVGDDEDPAEEPATAEIHVSTGQARSFVERARELVQAGRPPCAFCGRPLDDDDGWCPCFN